MAERQMTCYGVKRNVGKKLFCRIRDFKAFIMIKPLRCYRGGQHLTRQIGRMTKGRMEQLMEYKTVQDWCM